MRKINRFYPAIIVFLCCNAVSLTTPAENQCILLFSKPSVTVTITPTVIEQTLVPREVTKSIVNIFDTKNIDKLLAQLEEHVAQPGGQRKSLQIEDLLYIETNLSPLLTEMNAYSLSKVLLLFANSNFLPSSKFMKKWEVEALATMSKAKPLTLAFQILLLGRIGYKPTNQFISSWTKYAKYNWANTNPDAVSMSLFGLHLLGFQQSISQLVMHGNRIFNPADFSMVDKSQLAQIYMYFKFVHGQELTALKVFGTNAKSFFERPTLSSSLEERLESLIKRKFGNAVKLTKEYQTQAGFWVDFFLEGHTDKLIIQVDGPLHFIRTESYEFQRLNDIRQDETLSAMGYKIKRISYKELSTK